MNKSENAMLAFNDLAAGGTSDKVYNINLDQLPSPIKANRGLFSVVARYGRRGGPLTIDNKTKNGLLEYDAAKKLFDKLVREKIAKGYVRTSANAKPPQYAAQLRAEIVGDDNLEELANIRPQELLTEIETTQASSLVLDDRYWMQDKSDGHSRGVVKIGGVIFGLNKTGKRVELSNELLVELSQIKLSTFQIDAELVGEKLVCRDLLHADGDLHALPYEKRFEKLVATLYGAGFKLLSIVETWEGERNKANALVRSMEERREGVVFKLRSAPHRAGRNGQHKKFKFIKTLSAIAGKPRATGKDSVEIFLFDQTDHRVRVGTVSLIGKPTVNEGDVIEVAYLYAHASGMLIQARLMRKRDDVEPSECITAQLSFKREEAR